METLKLNSNGKVIIPGLGNGKKKLTIKRLNDEIQHIPDTYSIDVDIESKQGLLPPERVTQKGEYPVYNYFKMLYRESMLAIPMGCNGFIPDYIDTENLTAGDIVYIIDPKHDDTSKYVLDENRHWIYVGNYNSDSELEGVDGYDYSNVQSPLGSFWLTTSAELVKLHKKTLTKSGKQLILERDGYQNGDLAIQYMQNNESIILKSSDMTDRYLVLRIYQFQDGKFVNIEPLLTTLNELGIYDKMDLLKTHNSVEQNGIWIWTNTNRLAGEDPEWTYEAVQENEFIEQQILPGSNNFMSNPFDHEVDINNLIEIDNPENISTDDKIRIQQDRQFITCTYNKELGLWRRTETSYKKMGTRIYAQGASSSHPTILGNQAFWYHSKGTEPLTIRFK